MLAHVFLTVTARRPEPDLPEPLAACGNTGGEPAKKGS